MIATAAQALLRRTYGEQQRKPTSGLVWLRRNVRLAAHASSAFCER